MWVPSGLVYLGAVLGLFVAWLAAVERGMRLREGRALDMQFVRALPGEVPCRRRIGKLEQTLTYLRTGPLLLLLACALLLGGCFDGLGATVAMASSDKAVPGGDAAAAGS